MKNIYEAKSKYARVYFQINGDTVQIILPALKINKLQTQDITQIKVIFFYENIQYKSLFKRR